MIRQNRRDVHTATKTHTVPQKAENRINRLTLKDVNKPKDQQEPFIEKFKLVVQEDIANKVIADTDEYTKLVWDHILDNTFSPLSWVNDHKDDKAEKWNDEVIKDRNHTESAMAFETLHQIEKYDLDDTHNKNTKREFQAARKSIENIKEAEHAIQQTREYINNFASVNQKISAMGQAARERANTIQNLLKKSTLPPLAGYLAETRVKQIQQALAEIDKNASFVQKHISIATKQNTPTTDPALQQAAEKYTQALTAFKDQLLKLKASLESTKLAYEQAEQATTSSSLTTKNELLQKIKQAEEGLNNSASSFKSDEVIASLQRNIAFQSQERDRYYDQASEALEARKQRVIKEAQDLEDAASKAHIIADRDPGKATIADVWTSFRELNKFNFNKEGRTTPDYRLDIPKITVRNIDSKSNPVTESLDTSSLSSINVVDAKRMRKVTKITNMGTVSFEIDGNTFDSYETINSPVIEKGREKGKLTIERINDTQGQPIQDRQTYEFTPIPENLEPKIFRDPSLKTITNRKGEPVKGGTTTEIYRFVSNGQIIEVCKEHSNDIFTRRRPNNPDRTDEITWRKTIQTESTITKNKDGVEEKTVRVIKETEAREVIDFTNESVNFQQESYLSYKNARGQTVKEIREFPMQTLSDITIDLTTKNEKMSAETWVEFTKKALPDNPTIYDDEFKTIPVERLKQTDRVNLQARRFFLANGRSFSLDPGDPRTPDHTETVIGKNGLVFKMTGPVRNSRINVSMAGDTNLFNQEIRNKEKELIEHSQTALFNRIDCLQQSLQQAKTTSDIAQLEMEFKKAHIYDNMLKSERALAEKRLMSVPENKITAAEYKKDRKSKGDILESAAIDSYSSNTQQMVAAGNTFVKNMHDSIQTVQFNSEKKQEVLNTILAADQQDQKHTISLTEDNGKASSSNNLTFSSASEVLQVYEKKKSELSHFAAGDIDSALTAMKRREDLKEPTTEQMDKIKTTVNLLNELRKLSNAESTLKEFPHLVEYLQEISKQETALAKQLSKFTPSPHSYEIENENEDPTNLKDLVTTSIGNLTAHLANLKEDFTKQVDFKELSPYINDLQDLTKKKEVLTRQLDTLKVLPNQDKKTIDQLAASGKQIVNDIQKFSEEKKQWIENSKNDLATRKTEVVNKIQALATQLNQNTALYECMGKLVKDSNQMKDLNDLAHQIKGHNDLTNYLKQLSDLSKKAVGDDLTQRQDATKNMKRIEDEIETLAKGLKNVKEGFLENLEHVKDSTERIAKNTSHSYPILGTKLSDCLTKLNTVANGMRPNNNHFTQLKELSDSMVKTKNLMHQAKDIEQLANYVKDKQELTPDCIKGIKHFCGNLSQHQDFSHHMPIFKELYDDVNKAKEYFETKDTAYSPEIGNLINNVKEIENYIDNQLSNEKHVYMKNRLTLTKMLTAAAHHQFADIAGNDLEAIIRKDQTHPDTKNWLAARKAIEIKEGGQQIVKGVRSYIKNLVDPGLPTTIDSPESARQAFEHYWVEYLRKTVLKQVNDVDHKVDHAGIKIALQKVELMMQRKEENMTRAQELLGSEVSPEKAQQILDQMLHDIDDNSLLLPAKPNMPKDALTHKESPEDSTPMFNPETLKKKSLEQVSNEADFLAGRDFEYATKVINEIIGKMDDPILQEIYRKHAPKSVDALAKNATEIRKQLLDIQNWWRKIPEMHKMQWKQFMISILSAAFNQSQMGLNFVNDSANKFNTKMVSGIVG